MKITMTQVDLLRWYAAQPAGPRVLPRSCELWRRSRTGTWERLEAAGYLRARKGRGWEVTAAGQLYLDTLDHQPQVTLALLSSAWADADEMDASRREAAASIRELVTEQVVRQYGQPFAALWRGAWPDLSLSHSVGATGTPVRYREGVAAWWILPGARHVTEGAALLAAEMRRQVAAGPPLTNDQVEDAVECARRGGRHYEQPCGCRHEVRGGILLPPTDRCPQSADLTGF